MKSVGQEGERRDDSHPGAPFIEGISPLPHSFYARPAAEVARDLLGTLIVSDVDDTRCVGMIVETEAYVGPHDDASHAAARIGRTPRNEAMFGDPGLAYVYRIYGIHWCLNTVTDERGFPAAVLIRAGMPIEGVEIARRRRGGQEDVNLMRGPGNLCTALGITAQLNMHDLTESPLRILPGSPVPAADVAVGGRIGITRAVDLPLRFWIRNNRHVSRTR